MRKDKPNHLAYHETLEIHELVAFQATGLVKLKKGIQELTDDSLRSLYQEAILSLEKNIIELLAFFPTAPTARSNEERNDLLPFYAGDLLGFAKTSVRNYAIAITETATPSLRSILVNQLNDAIVLHAKVFEFMYARSYYPAYNLQELLEGDVELAQKAINMPS